MLFPKTMQKHLSCIAYTSSPWPCSYSKTVVHLSPPGSQLTYTLFLQMFLSLSAVSWQKQGSKSKQDLKEVTRADCCSQFCFQPGDTKQIPTVHLNGGLACHYKYFIAYILRTPQQLTASHLLSTCAPGLPSSLVRLF